MDIDHSASFEDYDSPDAYAYAMAAMASHDDAREGRIGGEPGYLDCEFAIEPAPGSCARREGIEDLADAIERLADYRAGAKMIVWDVRYGSWRYVTAEQIEAEARDREGRAFGGLI